MESDPGFRRDDDVMESDPGFRRDDEGAGMTKAPG
jgi:hypothetical protein